ncbi:MAG: DUF4255 domain-containing protein [Chloroflexota bacterium]|nr:MAG: DUF4255 domain-containing protein [Chloroflexota bacterium]
MSNYKALASATATLRNLLIGGLGINDVTARPLDLARKNLTGDSVNIFLYQTAINAAWRNQEMPQQVKAGETGQPPLPLCLYYLVTAYSGDESEIKSQEMLGKAMSILHDHPLLDADEIKATLGDVPDSTLHEQIERVRITPQALTLEEVSKLWAAFQINYRLSAAYQLSVVLIESTRPTRSPLPVLTRGKDDRGVRSVVGGLPILDTLRVPLAGTFDLTKLPTAEQMQFVQALPAAQWGDQVALIGQNLNGDTVSVTLQRQGKPEQLDAQVVFASESLIIAQLPKPTDLSDPQNAQSQTVGEVYPAGFYLVTAFVKRGEEVASSSNALMLALAPTITFTPTSAAAGNIQLTVTSAPLIQPGQRASLLVRDGEIVATASTQPEANLTFNLNNVPKSNPGEYLVRLRVDGVDSIPLDRQAKTPKFVDSQILKVT